MTFYINHYRNASDVQAESPVASTFDIGSHEIIMFRFDDGTDVEISSKTLESLIRKPYTSYFDDLVRLREAIGLELDCSLDEALIVNKDSAEALKSLYCATDPRSDS